LAVDPDRASAVARLFAVKKRQKHKPLLLLIENNAQLDTIVEDVPPEYWPMMDKYWPGPLTLVFPAKATVNPKITGGSGTVGVRISPHPIARELVRLMGKPITATSANISGHPPAQSAQDVVEMLGDKIAYTVDGGPAAAGLCSTIVGLQNGRLTLIRRGLIDLSEIMQQEGK
jgi:L-threonylcarbamoyladenylate synthase